MLCRIYVSYMNTTLYHVIYSVRYYPRIRVNAVGLGTYYARIRMFACIWKFYCLTYVASHFRFSRLTTKL